MTGRSARLGRLAVVVVALAAIAAMRVALMAPPARAADSPAGQADWTRDAPGRTHRIDIAALPAPYATPGAGNPPQVIARPANATLSLPPGFKLDVFATQLSGPRRMLVAANGDVFVSEMDHGRISVLHPTADNVRAAARESYLAGLNQPFGLAFYPNAEHPRWLYVAEIDRVTRYAYRTGDVKPRAAAEPVARLPVGPGHRVRDIAFSADGKYLFISVGSASNIAESMSKKSAAALEQWQAHHALGAAWDQETDRADVLEVGVDSSAPPTVYATGLRNCVSLTIQPATGQLWCTSNERDMLGDDLVPDYSTRVRPGGFYGWPWYYLGANEDPRLKGERPDLRGKAIVPDVLYQAHSAPLSLTFYRPSGGKSAFPAQYDGDAFVAFHGSWNRSSRTGYKLVRVLMRDGAPTGEYVDFLTGFIADQQHVWGRPVATAELADGSLLLSDDAGDCIYRISYAH
ncbi:MAG TPA: PQQ-dependent sugar dehydrogenase [Steroidobacteraceae bacterium]